MDIAFAGRALVVSALAMSLWSALAGMVGVRRKSSALVLSSTRSLLASSVLVGAAAVVLIAALMSRDFGVAYVANYTSLSTPRIFAFSALWAGMEGSLLFWTLTTAVFAAAAVAGQSRRRASLVPFATVVFSVILSFFLGVLVIGSDPFARSSPIPLDGAGLNPLLQSPFMVIHPVLLYLGLTGFAVPFAFLSASLLKGRGDVAWFTSTRRWTVLAWSFLSIGILLGAAWAYHELGWGGYWAWDPVENASFMPWLTGTAFLHSVMVQERRGMLKIWNAVLVLSTYCLAIFGTFLTRSGLLTSVHTFSESPVGRAFLPFLAFLLIGAFAILAWRFESLRSVRSLDSMLSREAMFLFNNLFLVGIAFTVLWGTLYPIVLEALRGVRLSVGPPFFNSVVGPIGLALLALTGIGPLVAWRRASPSGLRRQFLFPLMAGGGTIMALALAGVRSAGSLFAYSLCAFTLTATLGEIAKGVRAHGVKLISRNRRRYGGYIVHLGIVLIFFGLAGSAFKTTWTGELEPGDSFSVGRFHVTYLRARVFSTPEKMVNMAVMEVTADGRKLGELSPQRNFHFAQRQPQSEIGLRSTPAGDLYLVLTQMDRDKGVVVRAFVNPFVMWIWIGGAVMLVGMVVILSARPPSLTARSTSAATGERVPEKV